MSGSAAKTMISLQKFRFSESFEPDVIIDATGSKGHLMHGILNVPYIQDHYDNRGLALQFSGMITQRPKRFLTCK